MTACRKILSVRTQICYYTCSVTLVKKNLIAVNILRVGNVKKKKISDIDPGFSSHHIQFFFGQAELYKSG